MTSGIEIKEFISKVGQATRLDIIEHFGQGCAVDAAILGLVRKKDIGYNIIKTSGRGPSVREYFVIEESV